MAKLYNRGTPRDKEKTMTDKNKLAKDIQIAFFIDHVMARAYPNGITSNREEKVKRLRWYIEQDEEMPTIKEAVSFAKNIR
jgi:hypothetical protein